MLENIRNIHCLALNYVGVGNSNNPPLYFIKSISSLAKEGSTIPFPKFTTKVWTEVELGILISKDCENIELDSAPDFIEGFFVAADITCENIHDRDHHLAFSKSRSGFCPISTNVKKLNKLDLDKEIRLTTTINGIDSQIGSIQSMIYTPYECVRYISTITKLRAG